MESLVQTKDIQLEEIPPPPTQNACNAEQLRPYKSFWSYTAPFSIQAQVTTDFLQWNEFL